MYNVERKQQFLNSIVNDNSYSVYSVAFGKTEDFETKIGKDVSDMSLQEILVLLDMTSGKSAQSIRSYCSVLSTYTDWCIRNGKSILSENNFNKIQYTDVDKTQSYKAAYLSGDDELEEIINTVLRCNNFTANISMNAIRELMFRLLYEGFEKQELQNLKIEHIDFENHMIQSPMYKVINYKVSDRILELCKECHELEEIVCYRNDNEVMLPLCKNDYIFKSRISKNRPADYDGIVNDNYIWKKINDIITMYGDETGIYKKLTVSSIPDSKRFYDYYVSNESESYIDAFSNDICLRKPDRSKRKIYIDVLNFKKDYELWKKAFH